MTSKWDMSTKQDTSQKHLYTFKKFTKLVRQIYLNLNNRITNKYDTGNLHIKCYQGCPTSVGYPTHLSSTVQRMCAPTLISQSLHRIDTHISCRITQNVFVHPCKPSKIAAPSKFSKYLMTQPTPPPPPTVIIIDNSLKLAHIPGAKMGALWGKGKWCQWLVLGNKRTSLWWGGGGVLVKALGQSHIAPVGIIFTE